MGEVPVRSDDELLSALGAALAPPPSVEPSPHELAQLRSVVADEARRSARARSARWQRRVAAVVAGGVLLSGGTAYATSSAAPRPVRSAAFALKLPVEAPDLTDAKDAIEDLEEAMAEGRRDQVAKEVEDLDDELAELTPAQRAALEPHASTLLAASRSFLASGREDAALSGDRRDDSGSDEADGDSDSSGSSGSDDDRDDSSGSDGSGSGGSGGSDEDPSDGGSEADSSGSGSGGSDHDGDADRSDSSGSGSGGHGSGSDDSDSGSDHD